MMLAESNYAVNWQQRKDEAPPGLVASRRDDVLTDQARLSGGPKQNRRIDRLKDRPHPRGPNDHLWSDPRPTLVSGLPTPVTA